MLLLVAAGAAVLAVVFLLVIPSYGDLRLMDVNGIGVLVPLSIPVVLTLAPLPFRGRTGQGVCIAAAALLLVFVFLGSASIGYFFIPALGVMLFVGLRTRLWSVPGAAEVGHA